MKKIIAGVDIGNSSTEVAIAQLDGGYANFLSQHLVKTTGIKGTTDNVKGICVAIQEAAKKASIPLADIELVRLNDAVPVIGDLAMDLISETIITESSMIGHNPDTPGGAGMGIGITVLLDQLSTLEDKEQDYIVVIPKEMDYEWAAYQINKAEQNGITITGAIVQKDDGVLIHNRLTKKIPIVDEVSLIDKVPLGKLAAVEVALQGYVI